MRRTLLLDEDDLIMVIKEDVVKQIDDNRGEMNRTEFVTYLIQYQLQQHHKQQQYVSRNDLELFKNQITEVLRNFLQFFISYGMILGKGEQDSDIQDLMRQLDTFGQTDEDDLESLE